MLKNYFLLLLCSGLLFFTVACNNDDDGNPTPTPSPFATVDVNLATGELETLDAQSFRVHAYTAAAPYTSAYSAYIVEGEKEVFILDVGTDEGNGQEVKLITDAIGKPINRIIISHSHPDHLGGLPVFSNTPVYAIASVREDLRNGVPAFGIPAIAEVALLPEGMQSIDGISFTVSSALGAESEENTIIDFGATAGIVFANDLTYNEEHLWLATGRPDLWKTVLSDLKSQFGAYTSVLCGHGGVATPAVFDDNVAYLNTALDLLNKSSNFNEFFAGMAMAYPNYTTEGFVGLSFAGFWGNFLQVPESQVIAGEAFMEGIAVYGTTDIYTSNFTSGAIQKTNFKKATAEVVRTGSTEETGWGMTVDPVNNRVLAIVNGPLSEFAAFFADPVNNPIQTTGSLVAIDPVSGQETASWSLPTGSAGNAVTVDNAGNAYMSDIALGHILKLDNNTDEVTIWAADVLPVMGGCVYDGTGAIYVHSGSTLVKVAINNDGSAAAPEIISLSGIALESVDGLAWGGNNTLYTSINGSSVGKITLDGNGNGSVEEFVSASEGIGVTSLTVVNAGFRNLLFINDGQLFSVFQGVPPNLPFKVVIKDL